MTVQINVKEEELNKVKLYKAGTRNKTVIPRPGLPESGLFYGELFPVAGKMSGHRKFIYILRRSGSSPPLLSGGSSAHRQWDK